MMVALALLVQAAAPSESLLVQRNRLLEAYWATNGPAMAQCQLPSLRARLALADVVLDRVLKSYRARAEADGTWQPPPLLPQAFFNCDQAEAKVVALEAEIASFKRAVEGP
jgi:hypothetical protein